MRKFSKIRKKIFPKVVVNLCNKHIHVIHVMLPIFFTYICKKSKTKNV